METKKVAESIFNDDPELANLRKKFTNNVLIIIFTLITQ